MAINIIFMAILAVAVPDAFLIFAGFVIFGIVVYLVRRRQLGIAPSLVSIED